MAGNLEFIKSETGTSVSSLDVNDCFSSDYDVYMISISKLNGLQASGNRLLQMRFIDTVPSVISGSEYDWADYNLRSYDAFTENKATSDTEIERILIYGSGDVEGGATIYIYNPYDSSSYTFAQWQASGLIEATDRGYGMKGIGVHKQAEQITGVNFFPNADTIDLTVSIYGVK